MKKLITFSFAFVIASMLCTSVFAQDLDIVRFNGDGYEGGLLDRLPSEAPITSGDVLHIKYNIRQSSSTYNDILSKGIKIIGDGESSGTAASNGGERVVIEGGYNWDYSGFYMNASASSEMKNVDLTGFYNTVIGVNGYEEGDNSCVDKYSPKLTLTDVNICGNYNGTVWVAGKNAEINFVSTRNRNNLSEYDDWLPYIGMNDHLCVEDGGTLNFKGETSVLFDNTTLEDGTINNSANDLIFEYAYMDLEYESVFNNNNMFSNYAGQNYNFYDHYAGIYVYDNSVFNNKGNMLNYGIVYLGDGGRKILVSAANGIQIIDMEEGHPVYNNTGYLENRGQVIVDYNATFNNKGSGDIENYNSIAVLDGGKFNNDGNIDNYGGIFVLGQFDNNKTINSDYDSEEYLYIGKNGGSGNGGYMQRAMSQDYDYDEDEYDELSQYAIFNNNGKLVYDYGLIDYDGILNNNGTIISNGTVEDRYVTIYGELKNKGKIDAKYLWLGSGYITGQVTGGASVAKKSSKISKAAPEYDVEDEHLPFPVLKNYGTVNVTEGIGGEPCTYIYNNGTINLGGEYNTDFAGGLIVDGGTINLMKDSIYFNNAMQHSYMNGTLNLVNETIDDLYMSYLYLKGTNDLQLDVKLEEKEGDFIEVGDVYSYNEDENGNENERKAESVSSSDGGRFLINKIKIMSDTERKRTEIPIANITPQEYINLGLSRVFGVYEYKVIITSETASTPEASDNDIIKAEDLTTGDDTVETEYEDEDENLDETGSEYGNTLVFIRKDNKPRNPEILQSKVAIAGANISQDEIFTTVFNNAGNYTFFQKQGTSAGDVEDRAAPTLWIKAFGSKEDVDLEEYTTIETTYYGAVVGLDWDRQYSDNFDATYGVFASYIGGELKDKEFGNKVDQSGGYIGVRGNWYIGKLFFNGIIDYALIQNGADTTSYSVDFNSQVAGLAARVGYNFEVANKSFTIQPNFAITGKYIMTDDYDAIDPIEGDKRKMEIDNITNLTFEPGLKLIKNLGRCWILTAEGKYVIENVSGDVKYDSQVLPDTSYDNFGYVGLGIEKIWGYTVLHLKGSKTFGGRDGYIINAGVEFKF